MNQFKLKLPIYVCQNHKNAYLIKAIQPNKIQFLPLKKYSSNFIFKKKMGSRFATELDHRNNWK